MYIGLWKAAGLDGHLHCSSWSLGAGAVADTACIASAQPGTSNGSVANGAAGGGATVRSRPGEKFSGLAIGDTRDRARQLQDELIQEGLARAVGKPSASEPAAAAPDGKRDREENGRSGYERDGKRSRRSRSREREDDRHRDRRRGDDGRDRRRDGDRDRDRDRHRDRDRDSDRYRDGGKGRGSPDGPRSNRMAPPDAPLVPTTAEQHGTYRAVVSNVMDFGAFCELQVRCRAALHLLPTLELRTCQNAPLAQCRAAIPQMHERHVRICCFGTAGAPDAAGGPRARAEHEQDPGGQREGRREARAGGLGQGHLHAGPEDQPLDARC